MSEAAHEPVHKFFKEVVATEEGLGDIDYVKKALIDWPGSPLNLHVFEYLQLRHFFLKVIKQANLDCMLNMKDFFECMKPMDIEIEQKQRLNILRKNQISKLMAVKSEQQYEKLRFDHELWLKIVNQRLSSDRYQWHTKEKK